MTRTVTFLSPGTGAMPTGGSKVMYEYANGLADRGWCVRIVHPRLLSDEEIEEVRASLPLRARRWMGYQRRRITGGYKPTRWFEVRPGVEMLWTWTLEPRFLPPSDAWVATYWYTAKWAAKYAGARLYLIQHLETWCGPETEVMATWKMPLEKVVISRWLQDVATSLGEKSHYVPNGLDFKRFGLDVRLEERDPQSVAMLYHHSDWKGSANGLKAMFQVKSKLPGLKVRLFGVPPRPADLPAWVEYHRNPLQSKLREIYNRSSIFVSPSWAEGWPLPPAEAMQCGAALIATDIGGHREYAHHENTALVTPPKEPDALAANILRMIEDQQLRMRLAKQGNEYVQKFTWDRAVNSFELVLKQAIEKRSAASLTRAAEVAIDGSGLVGAASRWNRN